MYDFVRIFWGIERANKKQTCCSASLLLLPWPSVNFLQNTND